MEKNKKNNNNTLLITGIIVVLIIIAAVVMIQNQSSNQQTADLNSSNQDQIIEDQVTNSDQQDMMKDNPMADQAEKNIVQTAIDAGSFSSLVTAVQKAELVETLSGEGPFTVFAPTDDAFAKLPDGTLETLLNDKEKLSKILTYHVVSGKIMSSDLTDGMIAATVQGQEIKFSIDDQGVKVNDAMVIQPDIEASNGVIHVIDTVILPK